MIRLVIKTVGYAPVAGAVAEESFQTYDLFDEALERILKEGPTYGSVAVIGAEVRP